MEGKTEGGDSLGPLMLPSRKSDFSCNTVGSSEDYIMCLFCNKTFLVKLDPEHKKFLCHLLEDHKFVVDNAKLIADFKSYIEYWRKRFAGCAITEFCPVIKTDSGDMDYAASDYFYLLCDALPEDKSLREKLQKQKLENILNQQLRERSDTTFKRRCLFCKRTFEGSRVHLFNHMTVDHNFNIGHSDNIVFGNELLDILEEKLEKLQCIYCEKVFKSWPALKEHMRKKQHKRIRPNNTLYDKYYAINYLEAGKNWETIQCENDAYIPPPIEDSDEEWRDWEEESPSAVCFFCDFASSEFEDLSFHMNDMHKFSYDNIKSTLKLNFYQQVKMVNYIRRQIHEKNCLLCNENFQCKNELINHMMKTGHISSIPPTDLWDQPKYYFPTYENDNFLCMLEDIESPQSDSSEPEVLAEDLKALVDSSSLNEMLEELCDEK